MFLVKPLIFLCLLCLGIGSGVLSELSDEVDDVLMLESDELLSLNRLSSETRRLDASGFSVVGLVGAENVIKKFKIDSSHVTFSYFFQLLFPNFKSALRKIVF